MAVNVLVGFEIVYLLAVRPGLVPALSAAGRVGMQPALIAIILVSLLQLGFTYLEPLQTLFATASLPVHAWAWIGVASLAVFALIEAEKAMLRKLGWLQQ